MANEIEHNQFDISIYTSKYVIPVLEKKWIVVFCFLAALIIALAVNFIVKPEFVSQGTLLVEEARYELSSLKGDVVLQKAAPKSYVSAEIERLKGDSFAAEVLKILSDKSRDELRTTLNLSAQIIRGILNLLRKRENREGAEAVGLISALKKRIEIKGTPEVGLIWITARTINKEVAPILVKSYIEVWLAMNLEENKKGIRAEREFANKQKGMVYRKFQEVEEELISFKKYYGLPGELEIARDVELNLELERMMGKLELARERLQLMDRVYLETRTKEAGVVGNIKVIDAPMIPGESSNKRKRILLFMIIVGGLAIGIGVTLLLDFINGPIRHENDIADVVHVPVLGYIPRL